MALSYSVTNFIPYKQIINNLKSYLGKFYFNALIKFGGIKKIFDAYGSNRDRIIEFTRSHLSAACMEKNMDLCKEIIAFLNEGTTSTQKPDIDELDHIIHYTVENHHIFSKTALNYANQNNDRILGLELLQLEKQVHQDKNKGLSCIMETLDSGPLLSLIIQTYKDFFPDKTKLKTIGIAVWTFIKVGLFSFLPILFDLYSDINLARDYRRFNLSIEIVTNETNCTSSVSSSALKPSSCYYNSNLHWYAYWITWTVLSVTLLLHLAIIVWYNEDDVSFLKNFIRVENKYAARVMVFFGKLLWPFRHIYFEVKYKCAEKKTELINSTNESKTIWKLIKSVESGLENSIQLLLQVWLLKSYFADITIWSFPDLLLKTMSGILYFLTFGLYSSCYLEKMLGKMVWSTLSIGISIALLKTDKPAPMELLQTIPICLSILCQVITRIFIFCSLTLLDSVTPVIIFTSLHFIFVFIIKMINTTKEKCSTIKDLFRIFISGVCSLVVLTHLESGETFFSQTAFFILIAFENLVMLLLPVIFPSIYPEYPEDTCFSNDNHIITGSFYVLVLWILGIVFQASYI